MNKTDFLSIMPYSRIVGQDDLKLALELAFISDQIRGVLISGHRGTGKSTAVRAFCRMIYGHLPTTLPINATEDRVIGGWKIDELMRGNPKEQIGLLEQAKDEILYVDEINLLDDHIVNIILDVTATNVLVIQREGKDSVRDVRFTLVGTMNPEEGDIRPQLLDRFGLMASITAEKENALRKQILMTVLEQDEALHSKNPSLHKFFVDGYKTDEDIKEQLILARNNFYTIEVPDQIIDSCITIGEKFQAIGHRADYIIALTSRALAAREGNSKVTVEHVRRVAHLGLQHRRATTFEWSQDDKQLLDSLL